MILEIQELVVFIMIFCGAFMLGMGALFIMLKPKLESALDKGRSEVESQLIAIKERLEEREKDVSELGATNEDLEGKVKALQINKNEFEKDAALFEQKSSVIPELEESIENGKK